MKYKGVNYFNSWKSIHITDKPIKEDTSRPSEETGWKDNRTVKETKHPQEIYKFYTQEVTTTHNVDKEEDTPNRKMRELSRKLLVFKFRNFIRSSSKYKSRKIKNKFFINRWSSYKIEESKRSFRKNEMEI